jgi:hypothetical protein
MDMVDIGGIVLTVRYGDSLPNAPSSSLGAV